MVRQMEDGRVSRCQQCPYPKGTSEPKISWFVIPARMRAQGMRNGNQILNGNQTIREKV